MRTLSFQMGLSHSVPLKNVQSCLCQLQSPSLCSKCE